ncbi:MAG: hypothetical protein ACOYIE_06095 [Agathobaculum sp.]|jgi:hypothetical protein|uniref:hypothetical protein n=1 Tax=Agathobaculum sp. TaxID=2048138 RepID=UPI003D94B53E
MSDKRKSMKNAAKNVLLVLLVLLMGLLCAANWLTGMSLAQVPADSMLRRLYDRAVGGAVGYELRASGVAAASPAQLALTVDGQLCGIQYSLTEVDAGMEAVRAAWGQALDGGALREADEQELTAALGGAACMLLRYHGAIPLGVLSGWMGGNWDSSLPVSTLVYAAEAGTLFIRLADGTLYAAPASIEESALAQAQQNFHGTACKFSGGAYAVYPETLLFEAEALSLPLLRAEAPALFAPQSGAGLETLLAAFGYTPYTRAYSEQGDRARVYVDGVSTLRVNASGLVQYAASGEDGTVRAYEQGEADGQRALDAQIDCARQILDSALTAAETDTHASLYAVQQAGSRTTVAFMQTYGGVPILGESDFATFVFEDGMLSSAAIQLQCFRAEQTRRMVMPARQAAAGAQGEARGLIAAYRLQEDLFVPSRFYF